MRMVVNTNHQPPSPIFGIISISIKHLSAHTLSHRQQTRYIASKEMTSTICVNVDAYNIIEVEKTVQREFDWYARSSTHTHNHPHTAPHRLRSGALVASRAGGSLALICSTNDEQVLSVYLAKLGQRAATLQEHCCI